MIKLEINTKVFEESGRYLLKWRVMHKEKTYSLARYYHPEELLIDSLFDQIMAETNKLIKDFIVKDQTGG